jgi:hypothetical protein
MPEFTASRRVVLSQLVVPAVWLFITGFGLYLHPDASGHGTHTQLGLSPCPSMLFFDRPCPGCGLTTSISAFLHLKFGLAFSAHPLGPIAYLILTFFAVRSALAVRDNVYRPLGTPIYRRLLAFVVVFGLFGAVRMITAPAHDVEHAVFSAMNSSKT